MIYAIGDIHGCLKALKQLLKKFSLKSEDELVFVGDYIDRGPESKGVIDFLLANRKPNWRFLRGNHEQMFLDWLQSTDPMVASNWLLNGGHETLKSYIPISELDEVRGQDIKSVLQSHMPSEHLEFLESLPLVYETADYFFCHAGINLDRPLNAQEPEDLLWIRRKFIDDPRSTPKLVIHGHTPVEKLDLSRDRINLDTGCVYGRVLSAVSLPNKKIYQVKR